MKKSIFCVGIVTTKRIEHCLPILIFAVFVWAGRANAAPVTNGSFEELTPGTYVNGPNDFMIATAPEGWTTASGTVDWFLAPGTGLWDTNWGNQFVHGASNETPSGTVGGSLAAALSASGIAREGVSQTLSGLTPGEMYELSFNQANGFFFPPPGPPTVAGGWEVFIDDLSILQATSTNDASAGSLPFTTDWTASSVTFEAMTATPVLTFLAFAEVPQGGQGLSFQWLDNVVVTQIVPEPVSGSMLIIVGLLSVGIRRRD